MSRWIMVVTMVLVLITPSIGLANHTDNWEKLDIITDQALQLVKHQKYSDAEKLLSYFSDQFSKETIHDNAFTMDEIRIISTSNDEARRILTSETITHEDAIKVVTKFRLIVDAIKSEHQPLWAEMETSVMTTFHSLKEAVNAGDVEVFQQELNVFLGKYDIIYPSVKLDLDVQQTEKINAYVTYMDQSRDELLEHESRMEHMEVMEDELIRMFKQMKEDDADPSLIWVMISTGSIIIVTLSYVGWRKYKGDKEKQAARRRLND
ncbi:sporulation protein YpjB [Bacillus pinisoli]|uniref:sporulation protein YpjB n=1 Tax=Bacillus pinisoli TaxID=2901866 RepID=UPI001FF3D114|nr:sporulation protein YpjB [Bacillus pinisoli]